MPSPACAAGKVRTAGTRAAFTSSHPWRKRGRLPTLVLEAALRYCSVFAVTALLCSILSKPGREKEEGDRLQVLWFNLWLSKILQDFLI